MLSKEYAPTLTPVTKMTAVTGQLNITSFRSVYMASPFFKEVYYTNVAHQLKIWVKKPFFLFQFFLNFLCRSLTLEISTSYLYKTNFK